MPAFISNTTSSAAVSAMITFIGRPPDAFLPSLFENMPTPPEIE